MTIEPKYIHDCESCAYMGSALLPDSGFNQTDGDCSTYYDFYICEYKFDNDPRMDSLIARFSDEGQDYISHQPSPHVLSAVGGLMQGMWATYHNVKAAGQGFVELGDGRRVAFS